MRLAGRRRVEPGNSHTRVDPERWRKRAARDEVLRLRHFARRLYGFDLYPWQIDYVRALLNPGAVVAVSPRQYGRTMALRIAAPAGAFVPAAPLSPSFLQR